MDAGKVALSEPPICTRLCHQLPHDDQGRLPSYISTRLGRAHHKGEYTQEVLATLIRQEIRGVAKRQCLAAPPAHVAAPTVVAGVPGGPALVALLRNGSMMVCRPSSQLAGLAGTSALESVLADVLCLCLCQRQLRSRSGSMCIHLLDHLTSMPACLLAAAEEAAAAAEAEYDRHRQMWERQGEQQFVSLDEFQRRQQQRCFFRNAYAVLDYSPKAIADRNAADVTKAEAASKIKLAEAAEIARERRAAAEAMEQQYWNVMYGWHLLKNP